MASASKKSLHASEQDRPDVARRRAQWKKYQGRLDPSRLVFIDETWAKTNMTRLHGRCRCGDRAEPAHRRAADRASRVARERYCDSKIVPIYEAYYEEILGLKTR